MLKPDAFPFPPEEVAALRARLLEPLDHELLQRDDRRYLFIRSAQPRPDPVVDLEAGLDDVPGWKLGGVTDIFLVGERLDLHVPAHIAQPVVEARLRLDGVLAEEARRGLDVHYGLQLLHLRSDADGVDRLLARVPRDRCADVTEADLVQLATRIGSLYEEGRLRHVRSCHLVAEQDALRFRPRDFLADLVDRWLALREAQTAAAAAATPVTEAAPPPPVAEPSPVPAPRRVEDATPLFEIEDEIDAVPGEPADEGSLRGAEHALARSFLETGYDVAHASSLPGSPFAWEATRTVAFPFKVATLLRDPFGRADADEALRLVRDRQIDLLLVVASAVHPDAVKRLAASRIRLLKPNEATEYRP